MSNIKYTIEFYSQWHCGSGLSAGADVDALVVKDRDGMPYVPGKTVKGLVREAVENLMQFTKADKSGLIKEAFGEEGGKEGGITGCAHFGNAELNKDEYTAIVEANASQFLYNKVTTTAISEDGTAQNHSLRSIETVVPCTLHGEITGVPNELADDIARSFGLIKRLGHKRTRGLGRCDIKEEIETNNHTEKGGQA